MKTRKPTKPFVYPEIQNNAAMAARVEEGVPVLDLVEFGRQAGFTIDELARLIHIPPRTYARRVAGNARQGKAGKLRIRNNQQVRDGLGHRAETRAENDGGLGFAGSELLRQTIHVR